MTGVDIVLRPLYAIDRKRKPPLFTAAGGALQASYSMCFPGHRNRGGNKLVFFLFATGWTEQSADSDGSAEPEKLLFMATVCHIF
jgi:hypothetical protein